MEFQLWWTGKTSFSYLEDGIADYIKRLSYFCKLKVIEFKGSKGIKISQQIQQFEENALLNKLSPNDFIILLDENGKEMNSNKFAIQISQLQNSSYPRIIFIIGGAYGFSDIMKSNANLLLSFSKFTLSHQLIRLVFMEQFYRAFTIINNLPYHNE